MKLNNFCLAALLAFGILSVAPVTAQISAVPQTMNFQGRLATPAGNPVANGTYSIRFSLWNMSSGGTAAANEKYNKTVANVQVKNGTFAVTLDAFPAGTFNGTLWLEVKIGSDAALTPRQPLVTVPYAFKAGSVVDGSITGTSIANGSLNIVNFPANFFNTTAWLLTGNSTTNPATQFIGTSDNQPLNFRVNNRRAMRYQYAENVATAGSEFRSINILGGSEFNTIATGVVGGTIAGGGKNGFNGTNAINELYGDFGFIGGGYGNALFDIGGVVAGGSGNVGQGNNSVISGGASNNAQANYVTIGGGNSNFAFGLNATIGGGVLNSTGGISATIAGGSQNSIIGSRSTIGGGQINSINALDAVIGGGFQNTNTGNSSTIGGGAANESSGLTATIAGGSFNTVSAQDASIGGGFSNSVVAVGSTIAGGSSNAVNSTYASIGGGEQNDILGIYATISGGRLNYGSGSYGSVGGGYFNQAASPYSTVPGGYSNTAVGVGSFAAGIRAYANHDGSFVWADDHDAGFISSAANQFSIRAYGGMVFEANGSMPLYTSATSGEKNRYVFLLNSPQTSTASGLKAGGILCADSYGYANPGKNDMIVKGKLSVGYNFSDVSYTAIFNGSIYANGSYSGSDARYKKNIASLDNALDSILSLRGVSYEWDKAKFPNQNFGDGKQIGFIAQEIEKIFPDLVKISPDGYKAVNYVGVIPVLVEAVKTLNARSIIQKQQNDTAQAEINLLKAKLQRMDALEARLNALEAASKRK